MITCSSELPLLNILGWSNQKTNATRSSRTDGLKRTGRHTSVRLSRRSEKAAKFLLVYCLSPETHHALVKQVRAHWSRPDLASWQETYAQGKKTSAHYRNRDAGWSNGILASERPRWARLGLSATFRNSRSLFGEKRRRNRERERRPHDPYLISTHAIDPKRLQLHTSVTPN